MPYSDGGFEKRTLAEIIADYEENGGDLFDTIDISPSSLIWQQMKVHALDSFYFETLLETAAQQMSIQNADGIFLDKHGELLGMPRLGSTKAEGYVDVTYEDPPFTIPAGTSFLSSTNEYLADDDTLIPDEIALTKTRTGESHDYFPSSLPYAETVDGVYDEKNNPISSTYWDFDTTYNNNIQWTVESSDVVLKDEQYFVEISGDVTKKVEVASVGSGISANAKAGEITTCSTYPTLTVTNEDGISGAIDEESDDSYRERLLDAHRRNFTLGKIRDIVLGINGVRAAKVYQNKGTDQTTVSDWDNPTLGANVTLDQYNPKYSQEFVPGLKVLSLGSVVVKGRANNDPPDIQCGVKRDEDGTGMAQYFDTNTFSEENLDPTLTGFQDIEIGLNYNGLDHTKTYRVDFWLKKPENDVTGIDFTTNYWELRTSQEGYGDGGGRYQFLEYSGVAGSGVWSEKATGLDLMFKTRFNGAAYTIQMAPADGYGFENLKDDLDNMLDYVNGGGLSPIGIQYDILEPDEVLIDVRGTIYIDPLADFQDVREGVISNIETYLESLESGDNVIYSRIEYEIMRHPSVWKERDLEIKRDDTTEWLTDDVSILDDEIPDLGNRSLAKGI